MFAPHAHADIPLDLNAARIRAVSRYNLAARQKRESEHAKAAILAFLTEVVKIDDPCLSAKLLDGLAEFAYRHAGPITVFRSHVRPTVSELSVDLRECVHFSEPLVRADELLSNFFFISIKSAEEDMAENEESL